MDSIVSYPERGNFGNNLYRGNFSGKLILDLHDLYKFDTISDYMRGFNTTGDVAKFLGIQANTYDLNMGFDLLNNDIKELNKFIIWHPPYWDIIKYSGNMWGDRPHPSDLSQIKDYNEFIRAINYCMEKQFASLKTGGRMVILMADVKRQGKLYSMLLDMMKLGTIESIVIKEQHNAMSFNKKYANNNFIRIVHEYLLILRRDNPYIQNMKITKNYSMDIRDNINITWKDLIAAVLTKLGGKAKLKDIYSEIEGHKKTAANNHWEEKIRQTLGIYKNLFQSCDKGIWQLAS